MYIGIILEIPSKISNGELSVVLHEKWGISCGTLVGQPRPSSPVHPTQSIRQNALVGLFTDIPITWTCVISVLNPPERLYLNPPNHISIQLLICKE